MGKLGVICSWDFVGLEMCKLFGLCLGGNFSFMDEV